MSHHNSSTSNSKTTGKARWGQIGKVSLWFLVTIAALDIVVNIAFPYPKLETGEKPGSLQQYFDYGRSVEAKVRRTVGQTDETTAPIGLAGWLDPDMWKEYPTKAEKTDGKLVAAYGMSFAHHIAEAYRELEPNVTLRKVGGPGAPLNHSYAAYIMDRERHEADVVMIGILASSVCCISTVSGTTSNFERPYPFSFPKYIMGENGPEPLWPPVLTLADLRSAMKNDAEWDLYIDFLSEHDPYYSTLLYHANLSDISPTLRMLRRAWFQHIHLAYLDQVHDHNGYNEEADFVPVLKALVIDFAKTAREDGRLPVIALIHNIGFDDHLYKILGDTLEQNDVPYISTHTIAPAADPANIIEGGHFTHEANLKFGKALQKLINENQKKL